MDCPACGAVVVAFPVPADLRGVVPENAAAAGLCTVCLRLHRADDPDPDPAFGSVSAHFPTGEAAVPFALLVGLLDAIAHYRRELTTLIERVERAGVDPILVLDRLASDDTLEPAVDIERRRAQLWQLLD